MLILNTDPQEHCAYFKYGPTGTLCSLYSGTHRNTLLMISEDPQEHCTDVGLWLKSAQCSCGFMAKTSAVFLWVRG